MSSAAAFASLRIGIGQRRAPENLLIARRVTRTPENLLARRIVDRGAPENLLIVRSGGQGAVLQPFRREARERIGQAEQVEIAEVEEARIEPCERSQDGRQ